MIFALVIAGGALGTAGSVQGDAEEVFEESEDERPVEESDTQVRLARQSTERAPARAATLTRFFVPQVLTPTLRAPTAPSWQRPRRTAPDDDGTDNAWLEPSCGAT